MGPLAITAAAGGVMNAAGAIYEGQAAYKAGQYNAGVLRLRAAEIRKQAKYEETQLMINARKTVGDMIANRGASGITAEGSPLDYLEESIKFANQDALNIRYRGEMEAQNAEFEAKLAQFKGESARTSSYFQAAGSLLSGSAKAMEYGKYDTKKG